MNLLGTNKLVVYINDSKHILIIKNTNIIRSSTLANWNVGMSTLSEKISKKAKIQKKLNPFQNHGFKK